MNYRRRQCTLIIHRAASAAGEWKLNIVFSQSKRNEREAIRSLTSVCKCVRVCGVCYGGKITQQPHTVYNVLSL